MVRMKIWVLGCLVTLLFLATSVHAIPAATIMWSSYFGDTTEDGGGVGVDTSGNLYYIGETYAGWSSGATGGDVFVVKVNPSGATTWNVLVGGVNDECMNNATLDAAGNVYIVGDTLSAGWIKNGYDTTYNGGSDWGDGYVMKISPMGTVLWSSYIGGVGEDGAYGVAVDSAGNVFVSGHTQSSGWAKNGYDTTFNGGTWDGYLAKFNSSGNMLWSTYIGGSADEEGGWVTVDKAGNAYMTGVTASSGWTSLGTYVGGVSDAYIAKVNANGSLGWTKCYGGNNDDRGHGIAIDPTDTYLYLSGRTKSAGGWIVGYYDSNYSNHDAFVLKLKASNGAYQWGTYLGGDQEDEAYGLAVNKNGDVFVCGYTQSADWTSMGPDTSINGQDDGFVAKLSSSGSLVWSTYLGGSNNDHAYRIVVTDDSKVFVSGYTYSAGWTVDGFDTVLGGNSDGFVVKINDYNVGGLQINISPREAVLAGGKWGYGYEPEWHDSGELRDSMIADFHAITLKPLPGWISSTSYNLFNDIIVSSNATVVRTLGYERVLPDLKLYVGESLPKAFLLSDYGYGVTSTYALNNFLGLVGLSGDTIQQNAYSLATSGVNTLRYDHCGIKDSNYAVKYSTYKMDKLPKVGISPNQTIQLNIARYCHDSSGPAIPPTFGSSGALWVEDTTKISASWLDDSTIQITAHGSFNGMAPITITAGTGDETDVDREKLNVYCNLLTVGQITVNANLSAFGTELMEGYNTMPTVGFVDSVADQKGTVAQGLILLAFYTTQQVVKITPNLSNAVNYESNTWYIARMRVYSPHYASSIEGHLFHFCGIPGVDSTVDLSANILFGLTSTWTWIEAPLYATSSSQGFPQIIFKNGNNLGNVFIDDIQIIKASPDIMDSGRGNINYRFPYRFVDSLSNLALGWSTTEPYPGLNYLASLSASSGKLNVDFAGAGADMNQKGMKLTATKTTGGVITPVSNRDYEVGMKLYMNMESGIFNSYDSIILQACYGVPSDGSYDFWSVGGQLMASAQFGVLTPGYHYIIGRGRNPYHQFQFCAKNSQAGVLSFEDMDFIRDMDNPYYGDSENY